MDKGLWDLRQLCAFVGVSEHTGRAALKAGKLPPCVWVGSRARWSPDVVRAWAEGAPAVSAAEHCKVARISDPAARAAKLARMTAADELQTGSRAGAAAVRGLRQRERKRALEEARESEARGLSSQGRAILAGMNKEGK